METLFLSLTQRRRPEDVAELVRKQLGERLSKPTRRWFEPSSRGHDDPKPPDGE